MAKFLIALLYHFCGEKLRGAVAGGADDGPGFDVGEAVGGIDEAVVLGEGAGGLVVKIGEVDLVEADGGNVVDPLAEEGFVFGDAEGLVEGAAGAENEIVNEGVAIVGEVEAGGRGLDRVVVGKEVGVGAELDFVEEDVIVAGADDVEQEILARFVERDFDFETEGFEFALEGAGEFGEIIGVDRFSVSYRMYLYVLNTSFSYYLSLFFVHSSLHFMNFCWKFVTYFARTWASSSNERIFYQNNAISYLANEYASFINRIIDTFISCIGMYGLEALGMAISTYFFPDLDVKSVDLVHDLGFRYFIYRFC